MPRYTTTRNHHSHTRNRSSLATTSDSNCNEVVVEVIMEAVVMDEVVMIMPIAMPSFVATVPGIVARTAMPNAWTNAAGSKMASKPTTWAKPRTAEVAPATPQAGCAIDQLADNDKVGDAQGRLDEAGQAGRLRTQE